MDAGNTSPTFADVSLIIAACAGKSGHCGIAYVDLEDTERVLYVADVMDPEFAQLDRAWVALLPQDFPWLRNRSWKLRDTHPPFH